MLAKMSVCVIMKRKMAGVAFGKRALQFAELFFARAVITKAELFIGSRQRSSPGVWSGFC